VSPGDLLVPPLLSLGRPPATTHSPRLLGGVSFASHKPQDWKLKRTRALVPQRDLGRTLMWGSAAFAPRPNHSASDRNVLLRRSCRAMIISSSSGPSLRA